MLEALIIGGGISGLTVAHASGLGNWPGKYELWECTGRLGGTIGTDRVEGYSVDWGPNGFLDREPLTLRLVDELGLKDSLEPANPKSEKRFIVKRGRLHPVPFSPAKMIFTGLLSPWKRLAFFVSLLSRRAGKTGMSRFLILRRAGSAGRLPKRLSIPWFLEFTAGWHGNFLCLPAFQL